MRRILITGMSGTGKSTIIERLVALGHKAIDSDSDAWCEWVAAPDTGEPDWIWREDRITRLLDANDVPAVYLSGCKSNQGRFHHRFDHIVLLTAPLEVMLNRVERRTTNPYGKTAEERALIVEYERAVLPLLRTSADIEIDTSKVSVEETVALLVALATSDQPR